METLMDTAVLCALDCKKIRAKVNLYFSAGFLVCFLPVLRLGGPTFGLAAYLLRTFYRGIKIRIRKNVRLRKHRKKVGRRAEVGPPRRNIFVFFCKFLSAPDTVESAFRFSECFKNRVFTQRLFTQCLFTQCLFTQCLFTQCLFTQRLFTQCDNVKHSARVLGVGRFTLSILFLVFTPTL